MDVSEIQRGFDKANGGLSKVNWILRSFVIWALGAIALLSIASSEITLHNRTPLDLSTASVEEIQSNTLVSAKITDTYGSFMYETGSNRYYYLVPMANGKFIVFCTGNTDQKKALDDYVASYNSTLSGTLDLEVNGRISAMTAEEKSVFYDSIIDANMGVSTVSEAMEYIVPYKIENDSNIWSWICLLLGIACLVILAFNIIHAIKKKQREQAYGASPGQTAQNEAQGYMNSGSGVNPYEDMYYTGYDSDSQASPSSDNNPPHDINRF